MDKTIQQMSDQEIVTLMRDKSLLNDVRQIFYSGAAEMEQANAQRERPSIIEQRKREFLIAQRIIKAVRDHDDCAKQADIDADMGIDEDCWQCGGEGFISNCFEEFACIDPEGGCEDCTRPCDICNPAKPPKDAEALRQVLGDALAKQTNK